MTDYVIDDDTYNNTGATNDEDGLFVFYLKSGDTLSLTATHTMSSMVSSPPYGTIGSFDSDISVDIAGMVYGVLTAISLGNNGKSNFTIMIGDTGSVSSPGTAVDVWGSDLHVENAGTIDGGDVGVSRQYGKGTGTSEIINSGTISCDAVAVELGTTVREKTIVENTGTIEGEHAFWSKSYGMAEITNSGIMKGIVQLGSGKDIYDGSLGSATGLILGGKGADSLTGGRKSDHFEGDAGRDLLAGGKGADEFIYMAVGDSTLAVAGRDRIADFSHKQRDHIDLSAIDANDSQPDHQGFDFIGKSAGGETGQVWFAVKGNSTFVYANTDTDATAELAIELTGKLKLQDGDFVL
jgi:Ca2+-binding RTX toxin-like protein